MRYGLIATTCLILTAAASAQTVPAIPPSLPLFELQVSPVNPTSADALTLTLSTSWPNDCIPRTQATVQPGDSIRVDLLFGDITESSCTPGICNPEPTDLALTVPLNPVRAGQYDVYVRAVDCTEHTPYDFIGRFTVTSSGAGEPNSGGGQPPLAPPAPGDRVILLEDNPPSAPQLLAGATGTVICCSTDDCSGLLLISWAFARGGAGGLGLCVSENPGAFLAGSAFWMDPQAVLLGRPFNQCGTMTVDAQGCLLFETDDGARYDLASPDAVLAALATRADLGLGTRIRLNGFLGLTRDANAVCPGTAGDLFEPVLTLCTPTP